MTEEKQIEENSLVIGWEFAYQNDRPCIIIVEQIGDKTYIPFRSFESEGKIELKDYRKQKEGEWKQVSDKSPRYKCTICNHLYSNKEYKYCPYCGAKMSGGKE